HRQRAGGREGGRQPRGGDPGHHAAVAHGYGGGEHRLLAVRPTTGAGAPQQVGHRWDDEGHDVSNQDAGQDTTPGRGAPVQASQVPWWGWVLRVLGAVTLLDALDGGLIPLIILGVIGWKMFGRQLSAGAGPSQRVPPGGPPPPPGGAGPTDRPS